MIEATSRHLRAHGIVHGFGGRRGGVSCGLFASANASLGGADDPAAVRENRRRFALAVGGEPDRLCTLRQVHGTEVHVATAPSQHEATGDVLVSATPNLLLAVTTADCVPVLLVDPVAGVAAAIHAGWRGAVAGVTSAGVAALVRLGAVPGRCVAAIGPCIRQPSYEVDETVWAAALARDFAHARFFAPGVQPGRFQFDLAGLVMRELDQSGVKLVDDMGLDTLNESAKYFSYRRSRQRGEAVYGVQLSGILVPG
ncbi:MAG: peptidoglycan editing factor PgeF [Pseudomonadota bacterium]